MFKAATRKLEETLVDIDKNDIPFPDDLELHNIGVTIYRLIPSEYQNAIMTSVNDPTSAQINKMNRKFDKSNNYKSGRRDDKDKKDRKNGKFDTSREWMDIVCSACGQVGHDIKIHGCDMAAMKEKLDDFKKKNRDFNMKTVRDIFEQHQDDRRNKKLSGKRKRNLLRGKLRAAKLEMGQSEYIMAKDLYIRAFKQQYPEEDLNDPREDNTMDIKAYDVLESEDENDDQ